MLAVEQAYLRGKLVIFDNQQSELTIHKILALLAGISIFIFHSVYPKI
jgi:hypothetical protein